MPESSSCPLVGYGAQPLPVPPGVLLGGYVDRAGTSTGTLDPLQIAAVAIIHRGRTAIICVADVPVVNLDVAVAARHRIADVVGTDPGLVWLAATHTHAGPDTGCLPRGSRTPAPWNEMLPKAAEHAAVTAVAGALPAELSMHHGELAGIGGHRAGAHRHNLVPASVLCARDPETRAVIGMFAVLAVHPTVLAARNRLISADLNGAVRRALPAVMRPTPNPAWCSVATGAAGDMSTRPCRQEQTTGELDRLGLRAAEQLGKMIDRAPQGRFDTDREITGTVSTVALRSRPPLSRRDQRAAMAHARARNDETLLGGDAIAAREAHTALQGVKLSQLAAGDGSDVACAVAALSLGGLCLVGVGAEPYSGLARRVDGLAITSTLVGYANGYCGYLPTRAAFGIDEYGVLISSVAQGEGERAIDAAISVRQDGYMPRVGP